MRGDLRWASSAAVLHDVASRVPARSAVVDVDCRLTYRTLDELVTQAARSLLAAGIRAGDRVAVWAPNSWRWIVAAVATHRVGAILVPANTRFRTAELGHVLDRTTPAALFLEQGFLGTDYLGLLPQRNRPRLVVDFSDERGAETLPWRDFVAKSAEVAELGPWPDGSTPADIMFTSGTTGYPKGVIAGHAQNLRAFADWADAAGMRSGDHYAITNPFFHTFGYKAGWLCGLMRAMTMYPHRSFDADILARQVPAERLTLLAGPPTVFDGVLARGRALHVDLSSVRTAIIGATSIPPQLVRTLRDESGISRVTTCYGLTEVTGVGTITGPEDDVDVLANTAGRPVTDVEVVVRGVDATSASEAVGESCAVGAICVRGYNVTQGYFDGGQVRPPELDSDGFLHTGDVGRFDEAGNLHVTDRLDDMFMVGGFNAYPAEIERLLAAYPEVAEVAVIGIPDQRLGEVPAAFVVPAHEPSFVPEDFRAWARERLANYKAPRRVLVVAELPRNASGKVVKRELRSALMSA